MNDPQVTVWKKRISRTKKRKVERLLSDLKGLLILLLAGLLFLGSCWGIDRMINARQHTSQQPQEGTP